MPFQRRTVLRELVNPEAFSTSTSTSAIIGEDGQPVEVTEEVTEEELLEKTLVLEDVSQLLTFVNLDSFTESQLNVTMQLQKQNKTLYGTDTVFDECLESEPGTCKLAGTESIHLYEAEETGIMYDFLNLDEQDSTLSKRATIQFSPCVQFA